MDMTNQEYGAYVNSKSKPSPLWWAVSSARRGRDC